MKRVLAILILLGCTARGFGQQEHLVTIDQLEARVKNGKDTTFIINLWATWCAPCLKEIPHFEKLQASYRQEKVKVILVSVDFKSALHTAVLPYVRKKGLVSEVYLLNEESEQEYIDRIDKRWSGAIPATLFIKSGKRRFVEKELTYSELVQQYQNLQL